MSVMFGRFFGVPQSVMRLGIWKKMRPGEKDLYTGLLFESERKCTRRLKLTDTEIEERTGAASRTLRDARPRLQELGLITYKKTTGNKFVYTICNPETGKAYPGDPKERIAYGKTNGRAHVEGDISREQSVEPGRKDGGDRLPPQSVRTIEAKVPLEEYGQPGVFS